MSTVKFNVGGQIFETTTSTIQRSHYLRTLINGQFSENINTTIFIDRSARLFEHVLCFLRNPEYDYPSKHRSELDFYGVEHNISDFRVDIMAIREETKKIGSHVERMYKSIKRNI
jgi:hypothetical protein